MARPILILHGWSDKSDSFTPLARALRDGLGTSVTVVDLADFLTLDDQVTYDDLAEKLGVAWDAAKLPRTPGAVDVVVHSTGGLVIRHWLSLNFTPATVPIKHLVMLAPANFGSPLAHKGWSFIGRIFRGNSADDRRGQVGVRLLKGLEMASEFSWELAMRERFGDPVFYAPGAILATVMVGNHGYSGLSAMVNKNGTDGTVYVSTANLNCARLTADFYTDPTNPTHRLEMSKGRVAFGVVQGATHKTITLKEDPPQREQHLARILRGLSVADDEFVAWCDELDQLTKLAMVNGAGERYTHGFQNTVVRLRDQYGAGVGDYTVEFFMDDKDDPQDHFAEQFHQTAIDDVHPWSDDGSYRSLIVDCTLVHGHIDKPGEALRVSLTAEPQIDGTRNLVGYRTYTDAQIGALRIPIEQLGGLFLENRTLFADLRIQRQQDDSIFRIHP